MQVSAFIPLLEKYQDFEISPANETLEKTIERLKQSYTDYYLIKKDTPAIGGIRILKLKDERYRVSPIFSMAEYQGSSIAQMVFKIIKDIYRDARVWELETILQEKGNCHLYEKMGYKTTGETRIVNEKKTLVFYEKTLVECRQLKGKN